MKADIILSGVGGQGILSIAAVIGEAALKEGLYMKQAEVHGMSQRGGSVVTYVRYGDSVGSPVVDKGEADYIVSFEMLEAARYADYLKPTGKIITSKQEIDPMPVITGAAKYPEDIAKRVKEDGISIDAIDSLSLALEAGNPKAANIVLIGRLSHYFDFPKEDWIEAIEQVVPAKFVELNKKAFELGEKAE